MEPIRVAPLSATHRSQLEEIVRATNVFSEEETAVALEVFDAGTTAAVSDYEFIGAFIRDRLVGYACFGATPATDRTYDLYWIAVHPDAQRSGAGSMLMAEMEHQLQSRPARLLIVETSSRDVYAPTRRFYHKRGYREAARLRDFYAPGDDRIVLSKRFSGTSDLAATQPPLPLSA